MQFQSFAVIVVHRYTEIAATDPGHEVHDVNGDMLGCNNEVAFILAALVIHQHDHSTGFEFIQNLGYRAKHSPEIVPGNGSVPVTHQDGDSSTEFDGFHVDPGQRNQQAEPEEPFDSLGGTCLHMVFDDLEVDDQHQ